MSIVLLFLFTCESFLLITYLQHLHLLWCERGKISSLLLWCVCVCFIFGVYTRTDLDSALVLWIIVVCVCIKYIDGICKYVVLDILFCCWWLGLIFIVLFIVDVAFDVPIIRTLYGWCLHELFVAFVCLMQCGVNTHFFTKFDGSVVDKCACVCVCFFRGVVWGWLALWLSGNIDVNAMCFISCECSTEGTASSCCHRLAYLTDPPTAPCLFDACLGSIVFCATLLNVGLVIVQLPTSSIPCIEQLMHAYACMIHALTRIIVGSVAVTLCSVQWLFPNFWLWARRGTSNQLLVARSLIFRAASLFIA